MRITHVRERAVAISRYEDRSLASGGLNTSIVAVVTDVARNDRPIIGAVFEVKKEIPANSSVESRKQARSRGYGESRKISRPQARDREIE
jgi:hypothetical protein